MTGAMCISEVRTLCAWRGGTVDCSPEKALIWYSAAMTRAQRQQFGLGTLLAVTTVIPLWFGWAESVGKRIEEIERLEAAAEIAPVSQPAVVFNCWERER